MIRMGSLKGKWQEGPQAGPGGKGSRSHADWKPAAAYAARMGDSSMATSKQTAAQQGLLEQVAAAAQAAGVFGPVRIEGGMLRCPALASAAPAEFRVFFDAGKTWVALTTADRWLSQSIEADLVHTGDKIEELLEEELVDLDWNKAWGPTRLAYEHFRDDHKLYTFRSSVSDAGADAANRIAIALLAYERAFRPLGDMEADDED